jgi:uncharacterized protein
VSLVRSVLSVCGALALLYGLLVAFAALSYKRILYPAPPEAPFVLPVAAAVVSRATPGGAPFHAIYFAARGTAPTLVLFHGNGETIAWSLPRASDLAATGLGVLLVEYRGYGQSVASGTPTEEGLYDDGAAALAFLAESGVPKERIVLWGTSLGTGVASQLAASGRGARLILCTPYTSIRELVAHFAWFLPTRLIVSEQFDTLSRASRIHIPTLVVHGTDDEVVPFAMGQAVADAIDGAAFVRIPGGHHNDLYARAPTLLDQIVAFARR